VFLRWQNEFWKKRNTCSCREYYNW
jgi:hypothetical protein